MNNKIPIDNNELVWQVALMRFVESCNPSFVSQNEKLINILSIGEHNRFEGPDFLNACVMIDGCLSVGDIEFHKKSSNWLEHQHSTNPNYSNVILHIVFDDDKKFSSSFETLIIDKMSLINYIYAPQTVGSNAESGAGILQINSHTQSTRHTLLPTFYKPTSNEDYQQYAILRLMRRTTDIYNLLQTNSIKDTFIISITKFLKRYFGLRNRKKYNIIQIEEFVNALLGSSVFEFTCWISVSGNRQAIGIGTHSKPNFNKLPTTDYDISTIFNNFINKEKVPNIGKHLKQEILTNSVLPLAFCLANHTSKTELLFWYWSAKTLANYGILCRKYPLVVQEYIWQQQGMLENYKEYQNRRNAPPNELLVNYSIPEIISYWTLNHPPYFIFNN